MAVGGDLLTVHYDDGVVRAVGEIDASTCGQLDEMLFTLDSTMPVLVDLSAVMFIDSSGLRVLIKHHDSRDDDSRSLKILNPSQPVRRLLEITGLEAMCIE